MREGQKEESPDFGQEVRASEGVGALPGRLDRYGKAKNRALDVAEYIEAHEPGEATLAARVRGCGEYLLFRHYFTVDTVRLHAASFCKKHLLCPLCAVRRGAKAMKAYLDRWQVIRAERPHLRPFMVTLTVKDGPDLAERFKHLHSAQHELWKRKHRGRGSVLDAVAGAVWSYEVKRGSGSSQWHPHLHMIALAEREFSQAELAREWKDITGDSWVVDVHEIYGDEVEAFCEVFKYAVKASDMEVSDTWEAFQTLRRKRLIASSGCFRGVDVPEELTDEPLEGLPFVELLFRHIRGAYRPVRRPYVPPVPLSESENTTGCLGSPTSDPGCSGLVVEGCQGRASARERRPQPGGEMLSISPEGSGEHPPLDALERPYAAGQSPGDEKHPPGDAARRAQHITNA